ncbi:MAG TPA: RlmE family RNA methyltransferase [Sandaracinaceae bacterium LLY-WYZ-13_1]|nr:RlmE family RNA methyltransferase [Sandaracinaceae bacterium LLY-WYZ-13_1]
MARSRRRRRFQDSFGRRAKREGWAARSVYKLEEIDAKVGLLRRGARVLDLGAYPGSWTTYAAERVQREGRVLGVDLTPFRGSLPPWAEIREGDVFELDAEALGGPGSFDVVMSDMAPSTTGHRFTDQARSFRLFMRALELATRVLAPGGAFVAKLFQGGDFEEAKAAVAARFDRVRIVKPKATRSESIEVFVCGTGFSPADEDPGGGQAAAGA